jgi:serine-type D-Ala-D-Ala carboxypeptidase/endopeptidase (penicillin-binding protein 4)
MVEDYHFMKTITRILLFFSLVFFLSPSAIAENEPSSKEFNAAAAQLVRDFEARHGAKVGVSTQVLKSGKVPFTFNGATPMIPASNLKVVTTAVALDALGEDFRFETRLYGPGASDNGVVQGDIVLKAAGDPTFFPPFVESSVSPFESMATALRRNGIRKVTGDLVIDDSDFDRDFIAKSYHNRYLLDSYAAPVGGLGLNRNVVTVSVGPKGMFVEPSTGSLQLSNDVTLGGYDQIWAERPRGTDKIMVHGVARPGSTVQTTLTVNDPVRFAGSAFFRILEKSGVDFEGQWRTVEVGQPASLKGKVLLARHRSPKLGELVSRTNVESDNLLAQHIFRRLGASMVGFGSVRNSEAVVRDFFKKNHISDVGLKMVDGSGLSEKNRIAPYQLVYLLKAMWDNDHGQRFIDSLPSPGEGTLRQRLGGAVVRAKTGTLNGHTGLTGYVVTAYGETVGFSILVNNIESTWSGMELQDQLVAMLARWDKPL